MKKFIISEEDLKKITEKENVIDSLRLQRYIPSEYTAISPLDGRYANISRKLSPYFSEFALVKNRVKVEVYWLQFLFDKIAVSSRILSKVKVENPNADFTTIFNNFDYDDFEEIKKIESKINHDVKAVEVWVADQVEKMGFPELKSYVHIGCTSEDITNPAYARMISDAIVEVWYPQVHCLVSALHGLSTKYRNISMLAHTHGQPATPTTVGKEMKVYLYRLEKAVNRLEAIKPKAKFNGATGNYSAIAIAFPERNWPKLAEEFVTEYLKLEFNPVTTQIESHDYIVEISAEMAHINRIISNLCSDMWTYISMEYFAQIPVKKEVGSSTMPHKVNPIDFENGEANLRKSTADLEFLCEQLMSTRMQRDLRDSTILRNIGVAFGHSLLGIQRTVMGFRRVNVNQKVLEETLEDNWEVLAEAIQTVLRKYGIADAYNQLKELTRGKEIVHKDLVDFLNSEALSAIPECEREALLAMKPEDYIGFAEDIAITD